MSDLPKDVVDFLKANGPPPLASASDLTIKAAAKFWEVSKTTAARRLTQMVQEGKMVAEPRTSGNGQKQFSYLPVKKRK